MINVKNLNKKLLYLSREDILSLSGNSSKLFVQSLEESLKLHAQQKFVQPLKPYLKWQGEDGHIADRIIAMPAYLGGDDEIAGLKWVGSKHSNNKNFGIDRASALIILNDTETHYPIAIMEGGIISGMRTAAVTTVACKYLAIKGFTDVTCIGCGPIAEMQIFTLLENYGSIERVHIFDLNENAMNNFIAIFKGKFIKVEFIKNTTAQNAISNGDVVITCTVTSEPYVKFEWIKKGAFVSNISIMDVHKEAYLLADKVIVDDWEQSNREKKVINQLVLEGKFSKDQLHAELGEILVGDKPGRETNEEIIILNPMGMAIEDISCAQSIYKRALELGVGMNLQFM